MNTKSNPLCALTYSFVGTRFYAQTPQTEPNVWCNVVCARLLQKWAEAQKSDRLFLLHFLKIHSGLNVLSCLSMTAAE